MTKKKTNPCPLLINRENAADLDSGMVQIESGDGIIALKRVDAESATVHSSSDPDFEAGEIVYLEVVDDEEAECNGFPCSAKFLAENPEKK